MIENAPGIYNAPSVYNQGGGEIKKPDPEEYKQYLGLAFATSASGGIQNDLDASFSFDDEIVIEMYYQATVGRQITLLDLRKGGNDVKVYKIQPDSSTQIRAVINGNTFYISKNNPDYLVITTKEKNYSFSGSNVVQNTTYNGNAKMFSFFYCTGGCEGTTFFKMSVFDNKGNEKLRYLPYKRILDNAIGVIEVFSGRFIGSNGLTLVGEF